MNMICVLSANLGCYDRPTAWPLLEAPTGSGVEVHRFDDSTFAPRPLAMTSRLQCGLVKMFPWNFVPGATHYLWIDGSCVPTVNAVAWFLERLGGAEIAVFRHPDRGTIREEVWFMLDRMARPGETYLNSRYKGERIAELYDAIRASSYIDDALYASTAFMCRPTTNVRLAFEAWWLSKTAYCLHDQIAWPWILKNFGVDVCVIEENYLKCEALTFTRTGVRRRA